MTCDLIVVNTCSLMRESADTYVSPLVAVKVVKYGPGGHQRFAEANRTRERTVRRRGARRRGRHEQFGGKLDVNFQH